MKGACHALGMSRSGYYAQPFVRKVKIVPEVRDLDLLERIKTLKTAHPLWGYQRVKAWLVHRDKIRVNQKRVRWVMKENGLTATQTVIEPRGCPKGASLGQKDPGSIEASI